MVYHAQRRHQTTDALLYAIDDNDTPLALQLLDQSADPDGRLYVDDTLTPGSPWQTLLAQLRRQPSYLASYSALDLALMPGAYTRYTSLNVTFSPPNITILKALLEHGADVNATGPQGDTILFGVVMGEESDPSSVEALRLVLAHHANVNARRLRSMETPLMLAAAFGSEAMVQMLLDKGADVNARDKGGQTPLFKSVQRGHAEIVRLLLSRHADPNLRMDTLSPLHYALQWQHMRNVAECIPLLRAAGAKE